MTLDFKLVRKRFMEAEEAENENRQLWLEDHRFCAGEQWPEEIRKEREQENRPCLVINRLPQFVSKVVGDARQNKTSIRVYPVDDSSDPEKADLYNGLIRHIETSSNADVATDHALECSVKGGWGYFRITTEYCDDQSFDQDIKFKRILNPLTVYRDPEAKESDGSDANWYFVTTWLGRDEFRAKYPKAAITEFEGGSLGEAWEGWFKKDKVRIAEYWVREPSEKTIYLLPDGSVTEEKTEDAKSRTTTVYEVKQYFISANDVLEEPVKWPGKYIPIIQVSGPEDVVDGRIIKRSLIRFAKDPQMLYNMWQTTITEKIALAPKAPFILTSRQIEGHEDEFNQANIKNLPYLTYTPDGAAPPPQRQQPAAVNSSEIQQAAQAVDDIKATTGIYDSSLGNQSNETSGKAILARQKQAEISTFVWIDNLARAKTYAGRIILDLIPKIYDGTRTIRILGEDGEASSQQVNVRTINPVTQAESILNDITVGRYDLVVETGPSYATKRQEASESMMAFIQAVPQAAQITGDLIAKNMDWPGADAIAERLKSVLPPGVDKEAPPMPPDPMQDVQAQMVGEDLKTKQLNNAKLELEIGQATGTIQEMVQHMVEQQLVRLLGPPPDMSQQQAPPGAFFMPQQ